MIKTFSIKDFTNKLQRLEIFTRHYTDISLFINKIKWVLNLLYPTFRSFSTITFEFLLNLIPFQSIKIMYLPVVFLFLKFLYEQFLSNIRTNLILHLQYFHEMRVKFVSALDLFA